jgi:hypothetical protein
MPQHFPMMRCILVTNTRVVQTDDPLECQWDSERGLARRWPMSEQHICDRDERYELRDARGIFCCFVCPHCEAEKRKRYRSDIFTGGNYWHDEPIEED